MTTREAIEIVERHQVWRQGKSMNMVNPKELTKALDIVLNDLKGLLEFHEAIKTIAIKNDIYF